MARVKRTALVLAIAAAAFCILEGTADIIGFVRSRQFRGLDLLHTEPDAQLGWVSRPMLHLSDYYGPGIALTTNRLRFRRQGELAARTPPGKIRIVCLGGSVTFGSGVADADTWPAQLEQHDARVEAVNMGQEGYGLDQTFLWYRREASGLDHHALIVAITSEDVAGLRRGRFFGYPKPRLRLDHGALAVKGKPLPQRSHTMAGLVRTLEHLSVGRLLFPEAQPIGGSNPESFVWDMDGESSDLTLALIDGLRLLSVPSGRKLIVVYLPTPQEIGALRDHPLRGLLRDRLPATGVTFLDLTRALETRARATGSECLNRDRSEHHLPTAYSREGNGLVADLLYGSLLPAGQR